MVRIIPYARGVKVSKRWFSVFRFRFSAIKIKGLAFGVEEIWSFGRFERTKRASFAYLAKVIGPGYSASCLSAVSSSTPSSLACAARMRSKGSRCRSGSLPTAGEPLNNSARSAFWSERPRIGRCGASDSNHSYGRVAQRSRCGLSGKTHTGRAFAGSPPRLCSLIWNNQTALAQAEPEPPANAPSRPRRVI